MIPTFEILKATNEATIEAWHRCIQSSDNRSRAAAIVMHEQWCRERDMLAWQLGESDYYELLDVAAHTAAPNSGRHA